MRAKTSELQLDGRETDPSFSNLLNLDFQLIANIYKSNSVNTQEHGSSDFMDKSISVNGLYTITVPFRARKM